MTGAGSVSAQDELAGGPGTFYVQVDAAVPGGMEYATLSASGEITVDNWPDAGGLMSGSFSGKNPLVNQPPANLSGTFCVLWSPPY